MTEEEKEAQAFLDSLEITPQKKSLPDSLHIGDNDEEDPDKGMIRTNQAIIDASNRIQLERLEAGDSSLRSQDLVGMKADAFKQNEILKWHWEEVQDMRKLIPSTINIQIINNN